MDDNEILLNAQENDLPEEPFKWITVFLEAVITLIMGFSVSYFILEVLEVIEVRVHNTDQKIYNNVFEVIYLTFAILAIIFHLRRNIKFPNQFFPIDFDNYPMLFAMILCAIIDVAFYFVNFITIITKDHEASRIVATSFEAIFSFGILPFVIICVCKNVRPDEFILEIQTKITLVLVMGGCLVIFMRRMTIKIERDFHNKTHVNTSNNYDFIHQKASDAEGILELFDITYILICLIFLIDPLRIVSKLKNGNEDRNLPSMKKSTNISFLERISLVKYRIIPIVLSIISVVVLIIGSYIITEILQLEGNRDMKTMGKKVFQSCNIVIYAIGIIFGTYYYFSEIRYWNKREVFNIRNDENFNYFSSSVQIMYAGGMILPFLQPNKTFFSLEYIEVFHNLLMAIQVLIQAGCINSAIRREVICNNVGEWKSKLFPPLVLAFINFGFMIISIVYSQYSMFTEYIKMDHQYIYFVIKDFALPVTILNRLHGTAFFIYLAIEQWNG